MRILKYLFIFAIGFTAGSASVYAWHLKDRESWDDEKQEEIGDLRLYYEDKLAEYEKDKPEEPADDEIVSVKDGIPESKDVNTHAVDYTGFYHGAKKIDDRIANKINLIREAAKQEHPTDEDDSKEDGVYEITSEQYGQLPGWDTIEMSYYTKDGGLKVSSWDTMEFQMSKLRPDIVADEEDEIRNEILPKLKEMKFDHEPYDVIYIRDELRNLDVRITKVYRSSEEL